MAWCRQATSHYLSQCWHRSMPPYGVTRPQWVIVNIEFSFDCIFHICHCYASCNIAPACITTRLIIQLQIWNSISFTKSNRLVMMHDETANARKVSNWYQIPWQVNSKTSTWVVLAISCNETIGMAYNIHCIPLFHDLSIFYHIFLMILCHSNAEICLSKTVG